MSNTISCGCHDVRVFGHACEENGPHRWKSSPWEEHVATLPMAEMTVRFQLLANAWERFTEALGLPREGGP